MNVQRESLNKKITFLWCESRAISFYLLREKNMCIQKVHAKFIELWSLSDSPNNRHGILSCSKWNCRTIAINEIDNKNFHKCIYDIFLSGIVEHIYFTVIDCVLPSVGRNYSSDITSRAVTGEICAVHNDIRHV